LLHPGQRPQPRQRLTPAPRARDPDRLAASAAPFIPPAAVPSPHHSSRPRQVPVSVGWVWRVAGTAGRWAVGCRYVPDRAGHRAAPAGGLSGVWAGGGVAVLRRLSAAGPGWGWAVAAAYRPGRRPLDARVVPGGAARARACGEIGSAAGG